jgi:ribosomal protein S27AE
MAALLVIIVTIPIVAVVALMGSALLSRGKRLKCPECGTVFSAPALDEKLSGLGWTFPYMGNVKCPKCAEKRRRKDYLTPEA